MKIAGLGFHSTTSAATLRDALALLHHIPAHVAVLQNKTQITGFQELATGTELSVITIEEAEIIGIETPTQSKRIQARFGTGSVAEALALVAARRYGSARLIVHRLITANGLATVALTEVQNP